MTVSFSALPGPHDFGAVASVSPAEFGPLDATTAAAVRAALAQHGLLVFRPGVVSPAQLARFTESLFEGGSCVDFSGLSSSASDPSNTAKPCHAPAEPTVRVLGDGVDADTKTPSSLLCRLGYEWHSDGVGTGVFSVLHCVSTPSVGGQTLFADAAAVLRAQTPADLALAHSLTVIQSNQCTGGGPAAVDAECGLRMDPTGTLRVTDATSRRPGWALSQSSFPLVFSHPTRGPALAVGGKNMAHVVGSDGVAMSTRDSAKLLSRLLIAGLRPQSLCSVGPDGLPTSATVFDPRAVLSYAWTAGDVVIWDNLALIHSTTPVVLYGPGRRQFYHIIISEKGASEGPGAYGGAGAVPASASTFFLGGGAAAQSVEAF